MSQTNQATTTAPPANQNEETTRLVAYMRDMLQELHKLAPPAAGELLPYLIDMAREEASEAQKRMEFAGF